MNIRGEAGAYDGDVSGALGVGGKGVAVAEVWVEGGGGVCEGLGFGVGGGDGLVGKVGRAGCLLCVGSVSLL